MIRRTQIIYDYLRAHAPLTALLGTSAGAPSIHRVTIPQTGDERLDSAVYPALVIRTVSEQPLHRKGEGLDEWEQDVDITAYSYSPDTNEEILDAVHDVLHYIASQTVDNYKVGRIIAAGRSGELYNDKTGTYAWTATFATYIKKIA